MMMKRKIRGKTIPRNLSDRFIQWIGICGTDRQNWYIGTETCTPFEPLFQRISAVIRSQFLDSNYLDLCQFCQYFDDKSFCYPACRDGASFDWCVDQRSYGRYGAWRYSKCGKQGKWFVPKEIDQCGGDVWWLKREICPYSHQWWLLALSSMSALNQITRKCVNCYGYIMATSRSFTVIMASDNVPFAWSTSTGIRWTRYA